MQLKISFGMDNAAFEMPGPEAARIVREIADKLEGFTFSKPNAGVIYPIRDVNGNRIGSYSYERDDDETEGED